MMHQEKPTIACFGATGGCVATALASALKDGYCCTALIRDPDKLHKILITQKGVPSGIVDRYLTVHRGDVKDPTAVAQALVSPTDAKFVVDFMLSGVGSRPTFEWSITRPLPLQDKTICEDAIKAIYTALSNLSASGITGTTRSQKPLLVAVSAAGCGRKRGIPLPVYLPYHYVVGGPLADKQKMEDLIFKDGGRHVRDFVLMRPVILTDGKAKSDGQLQVGWEWGVVSDEDNVKEPGPKIGYLISKEDLGKWVFDHVITEVLKYGQE
ncbi:uncharacterized protein FIESC28_02304 [Fusarium coffeatum]|uniref:NAD(P)-binding domain-containing protein n=1 Tax=Fusarium coffeatum TaxID=231269 RepID=A0A366S882_9HYPO|nr:uncharacterized protein FIESC28_02304 [Fusarium coffeatum]RBR24886.1 hypothetical protein FIESC28_02304 [Fusarium coffeatum]